MRIASALLVDEIRKHSDGRVDLLGLFEDLYLDAVPATLESVQAYLELEFDAEDRGQRHELELQLLGPDGRPGQAPWTIRFAVPAESAFPRGGAPLDLSLFALTFRAFGPHLLEIRHRGATLRRLPLYVSQRHE